MGDVMNKELLKGTTDILVLRMLKIEAMYGYGMIKKLEILSKGTFKFKEGTLYPILHNLEKGGYVESFWQTPESGRRRKYYQLTKKGTVQLKAKEEEWNAFSKAVNDVLYI